MAKIDLGKVVGEQGPAGPPGERGPIGPAGPKGTGIDITQETQNADLFRENGYKWISKTRQGYPKQSHSDIGVISYITADDTTHTAKGGVQTFYETYASTPDHVGRIFTRCHHEDIWTGNGEWSEIMTNKDVYRQSEWDATDTVVTPDTHIKEQGYLEFPKKLGDHKLVLCWFKVDCGKYDKDILVLDKLEKILSVQVTQNDQSPTHEDDKFVQFNVAVTEKNNIVINTTETKTAHAFVLVIGLAKSGQ